MQLLYVFALVCLAAALPRVRRDHHGDHTHEAHDYSVETLIDKVLPWLTEEQKTTLRGLKDDHDALFSKVEEYFKAQEGDSKKEAGEKLVGACRHIMSDALGDEKTAEIKKLKESGSGFDVIETKVNEMLDAAADSEAKKVALKVKPSCKKVFQWSYSQKAEATAARMRREIKYDLETAFEKILTFLNDEQKTALRAIKDDKAALYAKVEEYLKELQGDAKKEAMEKIKGGCKHIFSTAIGEEKTEEVKKLKESGASVDDMEKKVTELLTAAADSPSKTIAEGVLPYCKKVYHWAATNA